MHGHARSTMASPLRHDPYALGRTATSTPLAPAPCDDAGGGSHRLRHHPRRHDTPGTSDARTHQTPATTDTAPRGDRQPTDVRRAEPNARLHLLPEAGATQERTL